MIARVGPQASGRFLIECVSRQLGRGDLRVSDANASVGVANPQHPAPISRTNTIVCKFVLQWIAFCFFLRLAKTKVGFEK